jgi:hypothetical protein
MLPFRSTKTFSGCNSGISQENGVIDQIKPYRKVYEHEKEQGQIIVVQMLHEESSVVCLSTLRSLW